MKRAITTTVLTSVAICIFVYVPYILGLYIDFIDRKPNCVGIWMSGFMLIVLIALVISIITGVWLSIHETIKNLTSDEE